MCEFTGKCGGTFAHQDIAVKFTSRISTVFDFYLMKEFQELKIQELKELDLSTKQELANINYNIHTDTIKRYFVSSLTEE